MSDPRPPLLYLVHRIPYPPNKGDKLRSFNILRHLARRYRVYLGCFVDDPADLAHVGMLRRWCAEVRVQRIHPLRARIASLRGMLRHEALSLPYYRSPGIGRWVDEVIEREGIRLGVAFSGPMAQYLCHPALNRRIVDFCDVDSAKWTQYARNKPWPLSWLYRREGQLLLEYERRVAAYVEAAVFVTESEARLFRSLAVEALPSVTVMNNGVDAEYFQPHLEAPSPMSRPGPALVFTGAMDYWPNIDAVQWFCQSVMPALRTRVPGIGFWIVGMNPTATVRALAADDVFVTGRVDDVRPYLLNADVVVAPLRIARGVQNKVLEAMACGRPVVVSASSANGLGPADPPAFLSATTAEDFVVAITALLDDPDRAARMGRAARQQVLTRVSWSSHLAHLDTLLGIEMPAVEAVPA